MAKDEILCERCGQEIFSQAIMIDTNSLTGKADYWRNSPRRIRMCNDCCKELSNLVDDFLLKPGILKSKFCSKQNGLA